MDQNTLALSSSSDLQLLYRSLFAFVRHVRASKGVYTEMQNPGNGTREL